MRLATALDEIAPLRDPRVKSNQAYLVIILLARVITRLGQISEVNPKIVEGLFSSDLAYLQRFETIRILLEHRIAVADPEEVGLGREGSGDGGEAVMAIGVESRAESYGLLIDSVGEVLKLDDAAREPNPINLDQRLARMSAGIYRLGGQLLIVVDVDRVLDIGTSAIAA